MVKQAVLLYQIYTYVVIHLCQLAVLTHGEQQKRNCGILQREMIHCKRNLNGKIDISLIEDIRKEIMDNTKPIVILGIPMTKGAMAALRTYFVGAAATLIIEWYLSEYD